ncbi:MAG: DNA polymerase III subunit gamma/tau [Megasphaera sp.]|uniref:DNA polymerase III subunit gamma/tau n=1 Tax=Megasphaera sp. TaxID=2023260 RepID=UPI0025BEF6F9|nr:DNA polymerase III subunit gamma/tau [Megasphaera sp.]MCF0153804.1 DNA polymerase III subunit gamma/tau [Megasphaera sp.]MCI7601114.1 DNA polymerase III subunit gamma/tau [Megasphaera sp.]
MAYIALYRKWRPKNFEDVVGQSHITETLQKAIDTDKVAHAYLFSGPRGTGKTSTAKILARAMNCVHGPTSHPCNECEVCRHIMSGESLDVVEIDAASNRSIEDIRTLRETIKFMPAEGHKKIYIIDEVHMLTTEAFNALLKTLEEPPAHVIFILATTEPERIPMTILSRCQRYEFRRITSDDIARRLLYVAGQEQIDLTKGAAHILAVQADGGMRDALSMLDQCVSNTSGTIDEGVVRDLLGLIGKDWLFSLAQAIFDGKGDVIIKDVDDVIHMGKEPRVILTELLAHLRAVMLCQAAPASDTLSAYDDCLDELRKQAGELTAEAVFQVLAILQQALLTAKTSPVPRIAVEMGLLMASRQLTQPALVNSYAAGPKAPEKKVKAQSAEKPDVIPVPEEDDYSGGYGLEEAIPFPEDEFTSPGTVPDVRPAAQEAAAPVPQSVRPAQTAVPAPAPPVVKAAMPADKAGAVEPVQAARPVESAEYQDVWKKMCAILDKEKKKAVLSCIRNGRVVYIGEGQVIVAFKTAFMVKRANREDYFKFTDAALSQILGGTYHMQGFLEGDAELAGYEKKKSELPDVQVVETVPEQPEDIPVPAPSQEVTESGDETAWQPASFDDMDEAERAVLGPLLKNVGDCNIYIENKK